MKELKFREVKTLTMVTQLTSIQAGYEPTETKSEDQLGAGRWGRGRPGPALRGLGVLLRRWRSWLHSAEQDGEAQSSL